MKKQSSISLAGIAFTIENEAAEILENYLAQLVDIYSKDSAGAEIIDDIEARIAEILLHEIGDIANIVTASQINDIIKQLGSPDSFDEEDSLQEEHKATYAGSKAVEHRYYRDPDGAKLGGVLNGLATYMGKEVAIFRMAYILLVSILLFTGMGVTWLITSLLYFLMWLFTPAANTASRKLQLRGKRVTASSLESALKGKFMKATTNKKKSERSASTMIDVLYGLGRIIRFAIIAFMGAVAAGTALYVIGSTVAICCLSAIYWPMLTNIFNMPLLMTIATIIMVVSPMLFIIYAIIKILMNFKWKRYIVIPLGILFISSTAFVMQQAFTKVAPNCAHSASVEEVLMVNSDTLYIEPMDDATLELGSSLIFMNIGAVVDIDFNHSSDSLFIINIEKKATGRSFEDAVKTAKQIPFRYRLEGNRLYIDPDIDISKMDRFFFQDCDINIKIPSNTTVVISDKFKGYDFDWQYREHASITNDIDDKHDRDGDADKLATEIEEKVRKALLNGDIDIDINDDQMSINIGEGDSTMGIKIKMNNQGMAIKNGDNSIIMAD